MPTQKHMPVLPATLPLVTAYVALPQIREYFGEKVFQTIIPKNVKVEMATDEGTPIYDYAPGSTGANAYASFVAEFIQRSEGGHA